MMSSPGAVCGQYTPWTLDNALVIAKLRAAGGVPATEHADTARNLPDWQAATAREHVIAKGVPVELPDWSQPSHLSNRKENGAP